MAPILLPIKRFAYGITLSSLLLTGCNSWVPQKQPHSEAVRLVYDEDDVIRCQFRGDAVGSAGHWYNSWLINNDVLTHGALDDLRNKALALGADTVFVPLLTSLFKTSVTIMGQAFSCDKAH